MALQTSGAISLDQIHVEAGGTTGTTCSLNDSDIRNLTEASGKTINNTLGTTVGLMTFMVLLIFQHGLLQLLMVKLI